MRAILLSALILFIVPAGAAAGGFATVQLNSLPGPSETWEAELTVLAHGRAEAPVDGLKPAVVVSRSDGSERSRFPAEPTGEPGTYRAEVRFDSPGTWRYAVEDGYAGFTHRYPPVQIGARQAVAAAGVDEGPNLLLALLAAAVAGAGGFVLVRRRT